MKIASIASMGITQRKGLYHLWVVGHNGVKVFFCSTEEVNGNWSEDINFKAETDDFHFAYETLATILDDEVVALELEASLLF